MSEGGAYSSLALASALDRSDLSGADRRLAADLTYGTLRRLLILDRVVGLASSRPLPDLDPEVLALLRLGAYQLLFARIPAHAAVSETVDLAPPHARGFVNAVLRALARTPAQEPSGDDDGAISARTGLSGWAVTELRRLLPDQEVEVAAQALASPADLSLRANRCATTRQQLEDLLRASGFEPRPGELHPDVLKLPTTTPTALPGYAEGLFTVQDEASSLVVAALRPAPGERVLDVCAAPGGKAVDLACRIQPGGTVVAADVTPSRLALISRSAARMGAEVRLVAQDARRPALRGGFDAVLVDAPCSGLGAARRRPELLWRPRRDGLARLARLQVAILAGAAGLLRPGGRMVYSVCTFPRAETDAAVRAFLRTQPDVEPMAVPGPDGEATSHRLWPHRHGTDAMFFAGFRRRAGRS